MKRKTLGFFGFIIVLFIIGTVVFLNINQSNQQNNKPPTNYASVPTQTVVTIDTPVPTTSIALTTVTPTLISTTPIPTTGVAFTSTPSASYNLSPKIGVISLDTKKEDILNLLGEPKFQTFVHGNGSPEWDYQNGLTLYLGNFNKKYSGDIWRIIVAPPYNGVTAEGLSLGDTKEKFFQIYKKFGIEFPQGNTLEVKSSNDVTLYVEFDKNGKVSSMAIGRE